MKKTLSLLAIVFASFSLIAQEYPVGYGEIIDCGAFLVDNGMSAGTTDQMKIRPVPFVQ